MIQILIGVYVGGILASLPVAFSVRAPGSGGAVSLLVLSVGWPLVSLGVVAGLVRFNTQMVEEDR